MTNLVAVLGPHTCLGVNGHVEVPKDHDVNSSENVHVGNMLSHLLRSQTSSAQVRAYRRLTFSLATSLAWY